MERSYGIARAVTGAGSDLAIAAGSMHQLERASHKIKAEAKRKVLPLSLNWSKEGEIESLVKASPDNFGGIDVMVNNAGTTVRKPFLEITQGEFDAAVRLNLRAAFFLTQAVVKEMIKGKKGKLINIDLITSRKLTEEA